MEESCVVTYNLMNVSFYLFLLLYFLDCGWEYDKDVKKMISEFVFGGFCVFGEWWILMVKRWICWVDDEYDGVYEARDLSFFLSFLIFFISINIECNFLFIFNSLITYAACHIGVDSVKIAKRITIAKGLNLNGLKL